MYPLSAFNFDHFPVLLRNCQKSAVKAENQKSAALILVYSQAQAIL